MSSKRLLTLLFACVCAMFFAVACTSPESDDGDNGGGGGGPVVDKEDLNGITLKLDGTTHYLGNADVYRYSPANQRQLTASYAGSGTFHGTKLNYGSITVSNTLPSDSIQTCGSANTNAIIKLEFGSTSDGWGGTYTSTSCQIKLDYLSQTGGIEGTVVTATLKNADDKTITISNATFRVFRYVGYEGVAPEVTSTSAFLATLQIDSGSFEVTTGQHFRFSGIGLGTTYTDGNAHGVNLGAQSIAQAGNWACNQTFSGGKTNISVSLGTYQSEMYYSGIPANGSNSGAACSLKVVGQYNGAKMVTYSGILVAADNILSLAKRKIKVSGMWRNFNLGSQLSKASESSAGADSVEAILKIDSGSWHFPKGAQFRAAKNGDLNKHGTYAFTMNYKHGTAAASDFVMSFKYIPTTVGTYLCGTKPTATPAGYLVGLEVTSADTSDYTGIRYNAYTSSESPGSTCSIMIDTITTTKIVGRYTARLIASGAGTFLPDGDTTLTVSGSFRAKGLP
jgi:hypothetical protein